MRGDCRRRRCRRTRYDREKLITPGRATICTRAALHCRHRTTAAHHPRNALMWPRHVRVAASIRLTDRLHPIMRLAFCRERPYLVAMRRSCNRSPTKRQGVSHMENKGPVPRRITSELSCEHYMNAYERALARRQAEDAMLLADLTIRASHYVRSLLTSIWPPRTGSPIASHANSSS